MRGACVLSMAVLLIGTASITHAAYDVGAYTATFELVKYRADVKVTLDITYRIRNEVMESGYKYVGTKPIDAVRIRDDRGNDLSFRIARLKETKISWRFLGVTQSTKHVTVKFLAKNMLRGDMATNYFEAEWAGVLDAPVRNAEYRLVFPKGQAPTWFDASPSCTRQGNELIARQTAVDQPQFLVRFSPGIVDTDRGGMGFAYLLKSVRRCVLPVLFLVLLWIINKVAQQYVKHREWVSDAHDGGGCMGSTGCDGCGGSGCWS